MRRFIAALLIGLWWPMSNAAAPLNSELLVLVGVPSSLKARVVDTATELLGDRPDDNRLVEIDAIDPAELAALTHSAKRVVALGSAACEAAIGMSADIEGSSLTCALVSAEAFASIDCAPACTGVRAVVMDQPLERQVAVARSVYPALREFGALSSESGRLDNPVDIRRFRPDAPLPEQLNATLAGNDALIALPESAIFNRSTLHVILLTAYGNSKPVIGFSRAYVKAGALISAYSTPEQILREVLEADSIMAVSQARIRPPAWFSIAENRSIARSLGLRRGRDVDPVRDYADEDFAS